MHLKIKLKKNLFEFFEFFFNFDFQMDETHLKSFVFEILFIGDNSLTFYFFDGKVWSVLLF